METRAASIGLCSTWISKAAISVKSSKFKILQPLFHSKVLMQGSATRNKRKTSLQSNSTKLELCFQMKWETWGSLEMTIICRLHQYKRFASVLSLSLLKKTWQTLLLSRTLRWPIKFLNSVMTRLKRCLIRWLRMMENLLISGCFGTAIQEL